MGLSCVTEYISSPRVLNTNLLGNENGWNSKKSTGSGTEGSKVSRGSELYRLLVNYSGLCVTNVR